MTRHIIYYRDVPGNVSTVYPQFVYFCRHDRPEQKYPH